MTGNRFHTVLVVDDTPENIDVLRGVLESHFKVKVASNGARALKIARGESQPDLILLDIMMPDMDGYEVIQHLKADERTAGIPVMFVTAMTGQQDESKGLQLGAVDYITKPFVPDLVLARVRNQIELKQHRDHLEELVRQRTAELQRTRDITIEALASLAETRDPETGGHIRRTQHYVRILAEGLVEKGKCLDQLTPETIELLFKSAPLHDVGKVGVADNILLKAGKLSDDEFEEMKRHTLYGYEALNRPDLALGSSSFLDFARIIALTHQEKWDGSGYPRGLKGEEIPLPGRLMAVADVYDALISARVYKPPFSHSKAAAILNEGSGSHFDPRIIDVFNEKQDEFRHVALDNADSDEQRAALQS